MTVSERFVVLGLGRARAPWFTDLARLATAGSIPVEFVKSVSHEEARVRLASGRAFSVLLVDGGLAGVDRDLLDDAHRAGVEVFVVDDARVCRDWAALGATVVLPAEFASHDLITALSERSRSIPRGVADHDPAPPPVRPWLGDLVAVTGARGAGASTIAAAIAQGLVTRRPPASVLLADLALDADQGVLHHAPDVVPGLPELVDAHRAGTLDPEGVHSLVFDVEERGYHLLLGMRRRRGWATLRPRALEAALDSLLGTYQVVVGDIDPDLDGHHECGSFEVEDRNSLARAVVDRASVVVVVGTGSVGGLHGLAQVVRDVCERGVDETSVITVVNHGPRSPRERAAIARALPQLATSGRGEPLEIGAPIFVPDRRGVEDAVRGGRPLPPGIVGPVGAGVSALLEASTRATSSSRSERAVPVALGSLGRFGAEADAS